RVTHRAIVGNAGLLRHDGLSAFLRVRYAWFRQQWVLYLYEMYVGWIRDSGFSHCFFYGISNQLDLPHSSNIFRKQFIGVRDTHDQALLRSFCVIDPTSSEYRVMWAHQTRTAARHDHRDLISDLVAGNAHSFREHYLQRQLRKSAAEIVHKTVSLGLGYDRDDIFWIKLAVVNKRYNSGNIRRRSHRDLEHIDFLNLCHFFLPFNLVLVSVFGCDIRAVYRGRVTDPTAKPHKCQQRDEVRQHQDDM